MILKLQSNKASNTDISLGGGWIQKSWLSSKVDKTYM